MGADGNAGPALTAADVDPHAMTILRRLQGAGHRAVLAGGCVRDLLLRRIPADWDIATDATVDDVTALFERTVPVGERFGIVQVLLDGGVFEVAQFRREGPYSDGRRPDHVEAAEPEQDAQRRDFTINGLFFDPDGDGVVDVVDGRRDLAAGVIRAIGEPAARFAEDHLRTLRAVRFATRLDFAIEPATWEALCAAAPAIERVSAERVRDELTKIWTEGGAARGMQLLHDAGLLAVVLPEVAAMEGVQQPPEHHPEGDVWTHVRLMMEHVDALDDPDPLLAWGVLLHDVGKPPTFTPATAGDRIRFHGHDAVGAEMVDVIARRLRFSNGERERLRELTAQHMRFRNVRQMRSAKLKRFLRQDCIGQLLELHRIDCLGSHALLDLWEFCRESLDDLQQEPDDLRPAPLLTGHDLLAAGYVAGPRLGQILRWVEDEQLEGRLRDRDEALAAVRRQWPPEPA